MEQITFAKYKKEQKQDLVKFLAYFYNSLDYEERQRLFEWRYENNPYVNTPFIYLAFDKKKIIGFRAFVIQKFTLKDENFLLGTPADAVVHPQYRRQGLFSKLTKFAIDDMYKNSHVRFLLSLSANTASEAGNIKLNFVPIGKRKYIFRIFPFNILKNFFSNFVFHNIVLDLGDDIIIEISKELKLEETIKLMNKFTHRNKIKNVRDNKFYNWIFSSGRQDFIYIYYKKNDDILGYMCLEKKSRFLFSLVEYGYTQPYIINQLIKIVSKELSIPFLRLYIFTRDENEVSMFYNYGFRGEEDPIMKLLSKMKLLTIEDGAGMLIKPVTNDFKEESFYIDGVDTRSPHNWYLFSSDIH